MGAGHFSRISGVPTGFGNTLTVGDGGDFRFLEEALQFAKDNTVITSVKGDMDGTVGATQYDDVVTLSGETDDWNGNGNVDPEWASDAFLGLGYPFVATKLIRKSFIEINGDGIYRPIVGVTDANNLRTAAGWENATASGLSYDVVTITHWTIVVLPGRQRMSRDYGDFDCGAAMNVDLVGLGSNVSWLEFLNTNRVQCPDSGHFGIENLSVNFASSFIPFINSGAGAEARVGLDFSVINMGILHMDATLGTDVINMHCAQVTIDNVRAYTRGDTFVFLTDGILCRNVRMDTPGSSSNRFDFRSHPEQRTKDGFITNVVGFNGGTANAMDIEEIGGTGGANVKDVFVKDCMMPYGDIHLVSANGKVRAIISNCVLDSLNNDAGGTILYHDCVSPLSVFATNGAGTYTAF